MQDKLDQGYAKWKNHHQQILQEMYDDFCQFQEQEISFEQYCRMTYESLKQTETLNEDFGLGISIDF